MQVSLAKIHFIHQYKHTWYKFIPLYSLAFFSLFIFKVTTEKTLPLFLSSSGMHTSISEILKEKSLKPSRRSLPCLAQSQTHPINLNHFLSVPLSPEPKPEVEVLTQSISTSCSLLPPQTGQFTERTALTKRYLPKDATVAASVCITDIFWFKCLPLVDLSNKYLMMFYLEVNYYWTAVLEQGPSCFHASSQN